MATQELGNRIKNKIKKDKVKVQVNSGNESSSVKAGRQLVKKIIDDIKEIITAGEQFIKTMKSSLKLSGNQSSSVAVKDQMKMAAEEFDKRSKEKIKEIKEMVQTFVPL